MRIRDARSGDAPLLAQVTLAAARSHVPTSFWDLLFGHAGDAAIEAFLSRVLVAPYRSWWHHGHFLVAEEDGVAAAALSGFPASHPDVRPPESALLEAIRTHGWSDAQIQAGLGRAAPFLVCNIEPREDAWLVENVATLPAHRRQGHLTRLLPEILERGRSRGHACAQLTLMIGNVSAQQAYERVGFRVVSEKRHPDFEAAIGCPGLAKMECPL